VYFQENGCRKIFLKISEECFIGEIDKQKGRDDSTQGFHPETAGGKT
jgi:hypothetical protein